MKTIIPMMLLLSGCVQFPEMAEASLIAPQGGADVNKVLRPMQREDGRSELSRLLGIVDDKYSGLLAGIAPAPFTVPVEDWASSSPPGNPFKLTFVRLKNLPTNFIFQKVQIAAGDTAGLAHVAVGFYEYVATGVPPGSFKLVQTTQGPLVGYALMASGNINDVTTVTMPYLYELDHNKTYVVGAMIDSNAVTVGFNTIILGNSNVLIVQRTIADGYYPIPPAPGVPAFHFEPSYTIGVDTVADKYAPSLRLLPAQQTDDFY